MADFGPIWGFHEEDIINISPSSRRLSRPDSNALLTDLPLLLGAISTGNEYYVSKDAYLIDIERGFIAYQWTKDVDMKTKFVSLFDGDEYKKVATTVRYPVIRPSFTISCRLEDNIWRTQKDTSNYVIEFGEYPQEKAMFQTALEHLFQTGKLKLTGRKYTFDQAKWNEYDKAFQPVEYLEYERDGDKYIRVKANTYKEQTVRIFHSYIKNGDYVWVEVKPVRWWRIGCDLISINPLVSGIRFQGESKTHDFQKTELYKYMLEYMIPEMLSSVPFIEIDEEKKVFVKSMKR